MHLSESALREFREIYQREVGEELTDAEALECAQRVVGLVQLLVRMSEDDQRCQVKSAYFDRTSGVAVP